MGRFDGVPCSGTALPNAFILHTAVADEWCHEAVINCLGMLSDKGLVLFPSRPIPFRPNDRSSRHCPVGRLRTALGVVVRHAIMVLLV